MTEEVYRWPANALRGDFLRMGLCLSVCVLFLALVPATSIAFFALAALTIAFGAYFAQTLLRARTTLTLVPEGLAAAGIFGTRVIRWDALDQFALRYYTLRRDKEAGWLDLKLGCPGFSITIDDRLDGFRPILERAWAAASSRDIGLSSSTYANLTAAGLLQKSPV